MGLWFWVSLVSTLGVVGLWLLQRAQPASGPQAEEPPATPVAVPRAAPSREPFHAVAIRHGLEACDAAVRLAGQRFLPKEAPPLPLAGCDSPRCQCRYVHHTDRRTAHDRRNPWSRHAGFDPHKHEQDRRARANRRQRPWRRPRQP